MMSGGNHMKPCIAFSPFPVNDERKEAGDGDWLGDRRKERPQEVEWSNKVNTWDFTERKPKTLPEVPSPAGRSRTLNFQVVATCANRICTSVPVGRMCYVLKVFLMHYKLVRNVFAVGGGVILPAKKQDLNIQRRHIFRHCKSNVFYDKLCLFLRILWQIKLIKDVKFNWWVWQIRFGSFFPQKIAVLTNYIYHPHVNINYHNIRFAMPKSLTISVKKKKNTSGVAGGPVDGWARLGSWFSTSCAYPLSCWSLQHNTAAPP